MSETDLTKFDILDLIHCVRRELAYRHKVYRRLVTDGKMSQQTAERELALMEAILDNLESQQQPKLF